MRKRYLIIASSFLVIILLFLGYIIFSKRERFTVDALDAVPVDAAFIFETNDVSDIIRKLSLESKIWMEIRELENVKKIDRDMLFLDSIVQHVKVFREIIQKNPLFISVHLIGKDRTGFIWYVNLPSKINFRQIQESLREITGNRYLGEREYNRTRILQLELPAGDKVRTLSVTVLNGILMASTSQLLLENAVRQIELPEGVTDTYGFRKVAETSGKNVDGNLYVNFSAFPDLVSVLFNDFFRQEIEELSPVGNWAELDLNIKENNILLNGFTYASDSTNNYLNILYNQSSPVIDADEVLPANTIAYLVLGIGNFNEFKTRYNEFLKQTGRFKTRQNTLNGIRDEFNMDIEEVFYSFIDDEVGIALMDIKNFTRSENTLVFFETKSKNQAEEALLKIIRDHAQKSNQKLNDFIIRYSLDPETGFLIYKIPVHYLPEKIFGALFGGAEFEFFTFVDRYLFFGNSTQALSRVVHNHVLHRTLRSDILYKEFSDNLSARSNFQIYISIPKLQTILSSYITDSLDENLKNNSTAFQKLQAFAWQFTADNSMVYNNLFLNFQPVLKEEALTVWESMLDTNITMKPFFVRNHYTQDNEIFVQDIGNTIYLINSAGRILWKVPLREKIMGNVYQIDYYRNNKLQLLFNTRNQIHLIDRNGNYVERYPVNLRSPATNTLSVFDYDKNRNYRIFIAGEDRNIYVYSKDGNIVKGWSFKGTERRVNSEIQHFRIGSKDYIVFSDPLRTYILDRRGNVRVRINQIIPKSYRNKICLDYLPGSTNPRLAVTDTSGLVYFISFTGKIEKLKIRDFSADHFFDIQDLDGNGSNDLIFLDHGRLEVFKQNKSRMFFYDFDDDIDLKPVCYTFSANNKKIGIVSRSETKIYLVNNDGELYSGFPLTGNTLFSIGSFKSSGSRFNLIVGNEDNFLYNYSVQ